MDLVSSLVMKASESLNKDFALLLSYWKKRISTTLQVYTAKFILEASVSKRNPQRRQDIVDSALSSAVINLVYMVLFIYYALNVIKSFIHFIHSCVLALQQVFYRYNPADGANCEDALLESVHHEE